jgi:hypothetical protein
MEQRSLSAELVNDSFGSSNVPEMPDSFRQL